jgi:hypothetical protein
MCPRAPGSAFLRGELQCELCTTGIKKDLATLATQVASRVSKARLCITEAPVDVQAATVPPYSVVLAQLTTHGHSYSGDVTQ